MDLLSQTPEEETKIINNNNRSTTKPPLLFFLGELSGETNHAFFDPIKKKLNSFEIPELGFQLECLSSKHGWLLLSSRETSSIFFFNPITRQRITLPYRKSRCNFATFTTPPTSSDCMVFAIETPYNGVAKIDTFRFQGEPKWTRCTRSTRCTTTRSKFNLIVQAVYCSGVLYCIDSLGKIATFNTGDGTWRTLLYGPISPVAHRFYLVECNGEIFGGKMGGYGVLEKLYKLKLEDGVANWVKVEELGDVTFFVGPYGSCALSSRISEGMEKKAFVAGQGPEYKCVSYSFNGCDSKKDVSFDSMTYGWCYTPVWIERLG